MHFLLVWEMALPSRVIVLKFPFLTGSTIESLKNVILKWLQSYGIFIPALVRNLLLFVTNLD